MNRFMSKRKNTASTDRQNGDRMMTDFIIAKIHWRLINGNGDVRINIYSELDDME